jgi:hypothetical protein
MNDYHIHPFPSGQEIGFYPRNGFPYNILGSVFDTQPLVSLCYLRVLFESGYKSHHKACSLLLSFIVIIASYFSRSIGVQRRFRIFFYGAENPSLSGEVA